MWIGSRSIFPGNEIVMWQFDSLEECDCTKHQAVLGVWKRQTQCSSRAEHVSLLTTIHAFATFSLPLAAFVSFLLSLWSSVPVANDFVGFFSDDLITNKETAKTTSPHVYWKVWTIMWTNNGPCARSQRVKLVVLTRSKCVGTKKWERERERDKILNSHSWLIRSREQVSRKSVRAVYKQHLLSP